MSEVLYSIYLHILTLFTSVFSDDISIFVRIIYGAIFTLLLTYFIWMATLFLLPRSESKNKNCSKNDFYHYFVIPCLNEDVVMEKTMRFWSDLIACNERIKVIFVNDASDDRTEAIINENIIDVHQFIFISRQKPYAQKGKGDVLNNAYHLIKRDVKMLGIHSEKVIITIFDADATINRPFISEMECEFTDENIALVQARVSITPTRNWLELMQEIEFYTTIDAIQKTRGHFKTIAAGGNGQSVRLSAIEHLEEPWGDSLLEDYEFSLRLLLAGYDTASIHKEAVYQQAPNNYKAFHKQRTRWSQGGLQCIKYLNKIWKSKELKLLGKLEYTYFLFIPYISVIGVTAYLLLTIYMVFTGNIAKLTVYNIIGIILLNILPGLLIHSVYLIQRWSYLKWKEKIRTIIYFPTMFFYIWSLFPIQIAALVRQFRKQTNWVKTERHAKE